MWNYLFFLPFHEFRATILFEKDNYTKSVKNDRMGASAILHMELLTDHDKNTNLGFFFKLFTKRVLFSNYLSRGSIFIYIVSKTGCNSTGSWHVTLSCCAKKLCAMGCYSCSDTTTFRQAMLACVVLTAFSSVWPAEKVLWHVSWSNLLLKWPKYNILRHYYRRNTYLYKPLFPFHPNFLSLL